MIKIVEENQKRIKEEYQKELEIIIKENINRSISEIKNIINLYNSEIINKIVKQGKYKNNEIVSLIYNASLWKNEKINDIKQLKQKIKEEEKEKKEIEKYYIMLAAEKKQYYEKQRKIKEKRKYQIVNCLITFIFLIVMWIMLYKMRLRGIL